MKGFFDRLTGEKGFLPHPYQEKVTGYLLEGKNVFICAPTGAGKTWAALLPYLWAKKQGIAFSDRLIYVLPLRTLATTLYAETVTCCKNVFDVKTLPDERTYAENELVVTIQTGEQKNDRFFEGDIIFTTIDQCLSSYLNCPVSLPPKRLGNINAGALLGSLVIFDEFHLLEPDKAMQTAIEMLERLKPFSQFVIMTATLTKRSHELLQGILGGETIRLTGDEVLSLPSHKEKKRTYRWISRALTVDDIISQHNGKRSIVILNTVTRAQNIFKELKERLKGSETTLFLLHSRFYSEDRKKTEDVLQEWFGKDAAKTNVILVTTQVVEAGIDISSDNLHTELAPLNSIVQRAGRCARYEGERGIGTVWIYELGTNKKGELDLGPYRDNEQKELIAETRVVLEELPENGVVLDFMAELERLDKVHSNIEAKYLESYRQNQHDLKKKVHEAMDGHNEAAVRELVRDILSVNIIISNAPKSLRFKGKDWPRMLSVPPSSLYCLKPFFEECRDSGETVAWYPTEKTNFIDDDSELSFGWDPITSDGQIKNLSWLIVISPEFASYSPILGLQIGVKGDYEEPKYKDRPAIPRHKIHYETYNEHVQRVVEVCRTMGYLYPYTIKKLSANYNMSVEQLERLIEISCAFHDVGKLSVKWQAAIRKWQQNKNPQKMTDEPIAHSDYNPETDFVDKAKFPKQPPHASEGAYAVASWLRDSFGDNAIAVWTAIARHHGAFTDSLERFSLVAGADNWVSKSLWSSEKKINLTNKLSDSIIQNSFKDDLLNFSKNDSDIELWPLYAFLVRRLRLADQKSQKGVEE